MSLSNQQKNYHLMWRAGFGPAIEQLPDLLTVTPDHLYQALQNASAKKPDYINVADHYLQGLMMGLKEEGRQQKKERPAEERKMIRAKSRESVKNLNLYWLHEMINSKAQLREKMAFFWHGHFACRNLNIFFQQGLLDTIRRHALGSFRDLLHEVSTSAAMLNFLNNNQNRKDHPNENFAREVMELFTLGRGNYSEEDIKEAARAFTGWGASISGEFVFRKMQHDWGMKTILGKTGNFDGDEVLDILLEQKQTARFITRKLYRFFVNEKEDAQKIEWLADRFYKRDYAIGPLMTDIFTSDWFYEPQQVGVLIKSPIQLIAGIRRILPMQLENEAALLLVQRVLGQLLFYPPNVAGWPGGRSWIDSSTLMMRLRFPQLMNDRDRFNLKPKDDDDQMMGKREEETDPAMAAIVKGKQSGKAGRAIQAVIDWKNYVRTFEDTPREQLLSAITQVLIQAKNPVDGGLIKEFSDDNTRESFIRTATIQVMSTPEYQLC